MFWNLNKRNKATKTSADVVDRHLILSLLDAEEPKIWRMALDKIGTASFETKNEKGTNGAKLILKPKKGTAEIIASFTDKDNAVEALKQASIALQNKQKKQAPQATERLSQPASTNIKESSSKWIILFFAFVAVIGLYIYLNKLIPTSPTDQLTSSSTQVAPTANETGVPLSADDFLSGM